MAEIDSTTFCPEDIVRGRYPNTEKIYEKHVFNVFNGDNSRIRSFSSTSFQNKIFKFVRPETPQYMRIDESKLEMDHVALTEIKRPYNFCTSIEGADDNSRKLLTLEYGKKKDLFKIFLDQTISKVQKHTNDYSSYEVRIGRLTAHIRKGMEHLKANPYDKFCRFKLHQKVDDRRRLLDHLRRYNQEKYDRVCSALGITWQAYPYPPLETHFNKAIREAEERAREIMEDKVEEYKNNVKLQKEEFFARKETILKELEEMEKSIVTDAK